MINPTRFSVRGRTLMVAAAAIVIVGIAPAIAPAASPAAGETFVFRVTNGYSRETLGQIQYRIDKIDADRITVAVSTNVPALGLPRTEIYTRGGNGLRHTLTNHDEPIEYEFSPPYPAYVFPLEPGKSWSMRVTATNPATGQRNSVRVDGEVLGSERVVTPAGEFDTIKVRRRVYAGDWESFRRETRIVDTEWYAPALGRAVKAENDSSYFDPSRCTSDSMTRSFPLDLGETNLLKTGWHAQGSDAGKSERRDPGRLQDYLACSATRGDWSLFELVEIRPPK